MKEEVNCAKMERDHHLLCQSENLSLVYSSKLGVHLQVLLVQSLRAK